MAAGSGGRRRNRWDSVDPQGTAVQPKESKTSLRSEIDINDCKNRYLITKEISQDTIQKKYGVKVYTLGKYYPNRALATAKEPPLSLVVELDSSASAKGNEKNRFDACMDYINALISKEAPVQPQGRFSFRHNTHVVDYKQRLYQQGRLELTSSHSGTSKLIKDTSRDNDSVNKEDVAENNAYSKNNKDSESNISSSPNIDNSFDTEALKTPSYSKRSNSNFDSNVEESRNHIHSEFIEEIINIDIPTDLKWFNVKYKLLGPNGLFLKHIQKESNCNIQIRGIGSNNIDPDTGKESNKPMYMHLTGNSKSIDISKAIELCKSLISTVRKDYESAFKSRNNMHNNRNNSNNTKNDRKNIKRGFDEMNQNDYSHNSNKINKREYNNQNDSVNANNFENNHNKPNDIITNNEIQNQQINNQDNLIPQQQGYNYVAPDIHNQFIMNSYIQQQQVSALIKAAIATGSKKVANPKFIENYFKKLNEYQSKLLYHSQQYLSNNNTNNN